MTVRRIFVALTLFLTPFSLSAQSKSSSQSNLTLPKLTEVQIASSIDEELQPVLYWAPEEAKERPTPLFVFLHSWSGNYRQSNAKWHSQAVERGWIYLHPNFRGVNSTPKACGSKWARQDILDAVEFAVSKFKVDQSRIYLAGTSGGGHMAMLMAGHHPDRFSAVSAWVGISDLAAWYDFHVKDGKPQRYARMILSSLGGAPGTDSSVDAEYRDRSPIHHLHRTGQLAIQICAGINDGHTGSVPVSHSLRAYNVMAKAQGADVIPESIISEMAQRKFSVEEPAVQLSNGVPFGRAVLFEKSTGPASVVIFDGGHEGLPVPACEWLSRQSRHLQRKR